MTSNISNIIGWIIAIIVMLGGGAFMVNQTNKAIRAAAKENQRNVDLAAEKAAIAATKDFTKVSDSVESLKTEFKQLPCNKDSTYMIGQGKLLQSVDTLAKNQERIENKLDDF